jgi:hypothetical protein
MLETHRFLISASSRSFSFSFSAEAVLLLLVLALPFVLVDKPGTPFIIAKRANLTRTLV